MFTNLNKELLYLFLYMYFIALEFSFLTSAEKLIPTTVRGQLSYAVGNARALELAWAGFRNRCFYN